MTSGGTSLFFWYQCVADQLGTVFDNTQSGSLKFSSHFSLWKREEREREFAWSTSLCGDSTYFDCMLYSMCMSEERP